MDGWASGQLGIPKDPKFHHLQDAAGSLSLKLLYRLLSFDTHASPRTLKQPVHHWDPTTHIPGSFAAGFEGPGADTVQAIVQITSLLFDEPWDLDRLVFALRSEEHTSELQSLMRISYAVFCLKNKNNSMK